MRHLFTCLLITLWAATISAEEVAVTLSDFHKVEEIQKIIVMHYKSIDQNKKPTRIEILKDSKDLKRISELLKQLSSKGTIFKRWPPNIPTMQVVILNGKDKYFTMRIDNGRLQRPIGKGYGLEDFKAVNELVKILNK